MLPNAIQVTIFWIVQASALLVFTTPLRWPLVGLWAVSHFLRAVGLTLLFHRYLAHRAFKMNRIAAVPITAHTKRATRFILNARCAR